MPVNYIDNRQQVISEQKAKNNVAIRLMLEDIQRVSRRGTPMGETIQLRHQVSKRVGNQIGIITWTVPYASYQERGMRYDGSHVVKNYTTPGTGPHFARDAVEIVMRNVNSYYKNLL